ncbi:MAG: hypothetical protein EXQ88_00285 [Alphaproteobacteria bacterium]|nr:hypothetical protein [Alphaproteobacteria bacterium]
MSGWVARPLLATLALVACLIPGPPPAAQDAGPVPLVPRPPRPEAPAETPKPVNPAVRVEALPAPGAEVIGTRGPAEGGFPPTLWQGTPAETLAAGLARMPVKAASPTLNALLRRVLATTAPLPPSPGLIAARVRLLAALGDADEAETLLKFTAGSDGDPSIAWAAAELAFLAGDEMRACGIVGRRDPVEAGRDWQKAEVLCLAVSGELRQAQLALSLLSDQSPAEDYPLLDLFERMLGAPGVKDPTAELKPLALAAFEAGGLALPAALVARSDPGVARQLALTEKPESLLKLVAAIAAEAAGAITTRELAAYLAAAPFSPEERADATALISAGGPRALALLYQAAASLRGEVGRAEAVGRLLKVEPESLAGARRLSARLIDDITPGTEVAWLAPQAARARLAGGASAADDAWLRVARTDPGVSAALAPFLWLQTASAPPSGGVRAWFDTLKDLPAPERRARAELLYALLAGLGAKLDPAEWAGILAGEPAAVAGAISAAEWFALADAAAAGRVGETVLRAGALLAPDGPQAPPLQLGLALAALTRIGLSAEARSLALEAALARGF